MRNMRSYDEVMRTLTNEEKHELVVSTAHVCDNNRPVNFALVTLDGVTRGRITHEGQLETLRQAALDVLDGDGASEAVSLLQAAIEEVGFDRAIELLENQRGRR